MRTVTDFLRRMTEDLRTTAELEAMPASERRRMLSELGVDSSQLPAMLAGADNTRRLLPQMMRRFDLDPQAMPVSLLGVLSDMQRVCSVCPVYRECARALATGADREACSAFCPNADTMAALADEALA